MKKENAPKNKMYILSDADSMLYHYHVVQGSGPRAGKAHKSVFVE